MSNPAERRLGWRGHVAAPRSQLALWVYAAIVAVLVVLLLNALQREAGRLEAIAVETTLNQLRLQLRLVYGMTMPSEPASVVPGNPMRLLEQPPMAYRGEFDGAPGTDDTGFWYYDQRAQELVYRPAFTQTFERFGDDGQGLLRFRVSVSGAPGEVVSPGRRASDLVRVTTPAGADRTVAAPR